ncbi:MAG TPA: DUF4160 domain-containing protein [Roseiarcus sp.]|nr:DUF4160 domain-containing protein [Roseiarcus sp.]
MPVVFRHKGFRFVFYSNEGDPREPAHIHAIKDGVDAKFWLSPEIIVAYNDGFDARTLRELMEVVAQRRDFILRTWNEFFGES